MMKHTLSWALLLGAGFLLFNACEEVNPDYPQEADRAEFMHQSMKKLTDVIVHDIFSPPVASRIYVYPSVAAYEVLRHDHPKHQSLSGQLNDLASPPAPVEGQEYCYPLAALHAFLETGKTLIFSEPLIEEYQDSLYAEFQAMRMPRAVYDRSLAYGAAVSQHILSWADRDLYKQTRTYPKYTIPADPAKWKPTPPDYMDGIEPAWSEIRLMVLDSASQFAPPPPTPFSTDENSRFMEETREVYRAVKDAREEERAIAKFWDCNPYVSHHTGHVMYATKKITPGGHWINIARIAAEKADADLMKTVETYARVSISLFDGFISCWDEKYRSSLVRPETVINTYIDESWLPILQTPPFPEHTSGHSVISSAAAVALTELYGADFAFEDTSEEEYGLPSRSYTSFFQASEEAALSRLYGGIHYRPAIDLGVTQGRAVGKLVHERLRTGL